jgi:integrase
MALPAARVFPQTVTDVTRRKDFQRAGLPLVDAEGRVLDLHGLRTWLGTGLARAGVAPQIAQRILRHRDYRTTLRHYTVLGLADTAAALQRLPAIGPHQADETKTGSAG